MLRRSITVLLVSTMLILGCAPRVRAENILIEPNPRERASFVSSAKPLDAQDLDAYKVKAEESQAVVSQYAAGEEGKTDGVMIFFVVLGVIAFIGIVATSGSA